MSLINISRSLAVRCYSSSIKSNNVFSLRGGKKSLQPTTPVRTRFAPSPTGYLHLGSLRTALYNYLFARSTKGQVLLRLEDTDQKRLVPGAEENLYETLDWLGLKFDESPKLGGPGAPYRQSERSEIYRKHVSALVEKGEAYRCFCSKERLDMLRESAKNLKPPTTVTYDRHCLHNFSKAESDSKAANGELFTIRLKSPDQYPVFNDLLHERVNIQPQVNQTDRRYDDLVLLKSDDLPTYHLANVIDDHAMKITHVIRGEEWLPSTPKHIALYKAFGWAPPEFIHIPLLTTIEDKKLSKRSGDIDILSLRDKGFLKEALLNFSVLFGWSPPRKQNTSAKEIFSLNELENLFTIDHLTKGNAKVDFKKLNYLNKHYLSKFLSEDITFMNTAIDEVHQKLNNDSISKDYIHRVLKEVGSSLVTLNELYSETYAYLFGAPDLKSSHATAFLNVYESSEVSSILASIVELMDSGVQLDAIPKKLEEVHPKKLVFQSLRFAISGSIPGLKLPQLFELLGGTEIKERVINAKSYLATCT